VIAYPDLVSALRTAVRRLPTATADPLASAPPGMVTIHADGLPRPDASAPARIRTRNFRQAALLTEVTAEQAGTTAFECFGKQGPLALLPCAPDHNPRYAIVWCDDPELTLQRAAMTPARLSAALTEAVAEFAAPKRQLGTLRVCGPVEIAPLSRLQRIDSVAGRDVWIGNAAQALHPVAGQGLNLGLRDAFELARSLADNEYDDPPLSPEQLLARFAGRRRVDRAVTTGVTDLLASAFGWPLARPFQSALLTAMDVLPPLRRPLASTLLFGRR
ncbi:MAG TPA: FAD-dependent monooxygenase, partial [Lautropia sp.]|nr:FAD-dependent monooxygenase [Lautropia sp.]